MVDVVNRYEEDYVYWPGRSAIAPNFSVYVMGAGRGARTVTAKGKVKNTGDLTTTFFVRLSVFHKAKNGDDKGTHGRDSSDIVLDPGKESSDITVTAPSSGTIATIGDDTIDVTVSLNSRSPQIVVLIDTLVMDPPFTEGLVIDGELTGDWTPSIS